MRSRVRRVMGDNAQKRRSEAEEATVPDDIWQTLQNEQRVNVDADTRHSITEALRQAGRERK